MGWGSINDQRKGYVTILLLHPQWNRYKVDLLHLHSLYRLVKHFPPLDFFMNLFYSHFFFRYVANINQKWFKRIMMMVPKKLLKNQQEIKKIHEEIKDDYLFAVKKSIVDFVMHEPEIDEDER